MKGYSVVIDSETLNSVVAKAQKLAKKRKIDALSLDFGTSLRLVLGLSVGPKHPQRPVRPGLEGPKQ